MSGEVGGDAQLDETTCVQSPVAQRPLRFATEDEESESRRVHRLVLRMRR
jgi:hypothetical protein